MKIHPSASKTRIPQFTRKERLLLGSISKFGPLFHTIELYRFEGFIFDLMKNGLDSKLGKLGVIWSKPDGFLGKCDMPCPSLLTHLSFTTQLL